MTKDQTTGTLERVATVFFTWLLTWLTSKGYISSSQAAEILPLLLAVGAAIWGWWTNRPTAIVQSAAALPGTTVVTTPVLASSTPEANIVSSTAVEVKPK